MATTPKPPVPKAPKAKKPEAKKPKKTGRPSSYTDALATLVCSRLAQGESMRAIGRDASMPSCFTLFKWLGQYESFAKQYARAKEESADALFEEMIEIADDGRNDWMKKLDKKGTAVGWQLNGEHVQRSRLRIDSRKWVISKMMPKKYGEKLAIKIDIPSEATPLEKCDLITAAVCKGEITPESGNATIQGIKDRIAIEESTVLKKQLDEVMEQLGMSNERIPKRF